MLFGNVKQKGFSKADKNETSYYDIEYVCFQQIAYY